MLERALSSASRLTFDEAVLALHAGDGTGSAVAARLEHVVVELGLARRAQFLAPQAAPSPDAVHVDDVEVRHADEATDTGRKGWLRCCGVAAGALERVRVLAAHAALALQTIERLQTVAAREDAVRRIAERLQDSLLPRVPEIANTAIEVRYRAAAQEARVGGDFYDVFPLPDDRVLVLVGDVVGKGVEAASRTQGVTQTLRALALQGMPLEEMLERCDAQIRFQDPELMATLWCGLYEPATGELVFGSLGHPPALLVRPNDVIRLELEGLPLGMRDLASSAPECRRRRLEPRDMLVLYTDGVVEASGDYLAGQIALQQAITAARDYPLAEVLDTALDELLAGAGHTDDAVMLLLRRR